MTESILPAPMDEFTQRLMVDVELRTIGPLVAHLDLAGLLQVRIGLRTEDSRRMCSEGNLAVVRADVLEAVCRRLADLDYAPLEYFQDVYVADMAPVIPDNIAELEAGS